MLVEHVESHVVFRHLDCECLHKLISYVPLTIVKATHYFSFLIEDVGLVAGAVRCAIEEVDAPRSAGTVLGA